MGERTVNTESARAFAAKWREKTEAAYGKSIHHIDYAFADPEMIEFIHHAVLQYNTVPDIIEQLCQRIEDMQPLVSLTVDWPCEICGQPWPMPGVTSYMKSICYPCARKMRDELAELHTKVEDMEGHILEMGERD